jgi:hypothetical protein
MLCSARSDFNVLNVSVELTILDYKTQNSACRRHRTLNLARLGENRRCMNNNINVNNAVANLILSKIDLGGGRLFSDRILLEFKWPVLLVLDFEHIMFGSICTSKFSFRIHFVYPFGKFHQFWM